MKKKFVSVISIIALVFGTYSIAMADNTIAGSATRNSLKSFGSIVYTDGADSVEIHSDDLYMLADRLDSFKTRIYEQLSEINTYFSQGDKGTSIVSDHSIRIVHAAPSDSEKADPLALDFDALLEGLAASQSIPADAAEYGYPDGTVLYKTVDGEMTTDKTESNAQQISISAAEPGTLSAGRAAWVNGKLILGTGADNKAYYNLGYADGYAHSISSADVTYTYHHHTSGCYAACYETYTIKENEFDDNDGGYIIYTVTHSEPACSRAATTYTKYYNGRDSKYGSDKAIYNQVAAAGTYYENKTVLICPYKEGQIESAAIVFR